MQTEQGRFPPPPNLVTILVAGFDAVANHIPVILPPVLLDLFLWLGPHLGFETLRPQMLNALKVMSLGASNTQITEAYNQLDQLLSGFNLFSALRTFPVGSSSLMSFRLDMQTPLGSQFTLDAGSVFRIFGWGLLLALIGWIFGAIYFYCVAGVVLKPETRSLWKSVGQSMTLSILWFMVLFLLGLPVIVLLTIVTPLGQAMIQIALILGGLLLGWALMPIFFSAHGIFAFQQDALRSVFGSLRMVRFALPNTALFLLLFIVINQGLRFLWLTPPADSWWLLVGIAGHAFVSTALLAASFVYYRDINAWLKVVFEQLQKQASSARA